MNRYVKNSIRDTTPNSLKLIEENIDYLYQNLNGINPKKKIISISVGTEDYPTVGYSDDTFLHLQLIRNTERLFIDKAVDIDTLEEAIFNHSSRIKPVPILELKADFYASVRSFASDIPTHMIQFNIASGNNSVYGDINGTSCLNFHFEMVNGEYYFRYEITPFTSSTPEYPDNEYTFGDIEINGSSYKKFVPLNEKLIYLTVNVAGRAYQNDVDVSYYTVNVVNNTDRIFYFGTDDSIRPRFTGATAHGIVHQGLVGAGGVPARTELINSIPFIPSTQSNCTCSMNWYLPIITYDNVALFQYPYKISMKIKCPMVVDGYTYAKDATELIIGDSAVTAPYKLLQNCVYYIYSNKIYRKNIVYNTSVTLYASLGIIYDFAILNNNVFSLEKRNNVFQIVIYDISRSYVIATFCNGVVNFSLYNGYIYAMKDNGSGVIGLYRYTQSGSGEILLTTIGPTATTGKEIEIVNGELYFCRFTRWEYDIYHPLQRYDTLYKINLSTLIETKINDNPWLTMSRGIVIRNNNYYFEYSNIYGINGTENYAHKIDLTTKKQLTVDNSYTSWNAYNVIPVFNRIYLLVEQDNSKRPTKFFGPLKKADLTY